MKRILAAISFAGLIAAACGGAGTGAASSAPVAAATTARATTAAPTPQTVFVFTADLSPKEVVPPITDAEASGSGTATVTITTVKDATGKITSATAKLEVSLKGFPPTTSIVGLLAHKGATGVNGAGVINSGITADTAVMLTGGSGTITKDNLTMDPQNATDLIAGPSGFYVLAHSAVHPAGVARGQLQPKS